ncbi:MAG: hypothetical protein NC395_07140 [Prevotella sp.]|nr:hypothetical protein [Prevotella sp.]
MAYELKEYTLGSGHLHVGEADLDALPKTSAEWLTYLNDFCKKEDNLLGRIKGGASVEYTTEKTEDEDDLGYVVIEEITKEKVTLKSGMMTWNGETLETLCATARKETDENGITTVKIGGLGNRNDKAYIICFEHHSHKLRVAIVGKNNEGFTFSFEQDKATVIDVLFRAQAMDSEGTLIILQDFRKATPEVLEQLTSKDSAAETSAKNS